MRLAMAQMRVGTSTDENLCKTIRFMEQAKQAGADLIFFPELQLSPFFPQYEAAGAVPWLLRVDGPDGALLYEAGGDEELIILDVPLEQAREARAERPWLAL